MKERSAAGGRRIDRTKPYEAIVVDENDPDRYGQLRARVPGLMDGIGDGDLPWARPRWNHPFGQMAKRVRGIGKTSFFGGVPKRGNKVMLRFPTGDPNVCFWSADAPIDKLSKDDVYDTNYPNRMGMRLPNGLQIVIDQQTNELFFINPGDYHMTIFGDVNQTIVGNQQLIVTGDKGEVPAYLLNDPNMSAKYLGPDPQNRIPFKGLLGRRTGSQHVIIKGNQTLEVYGDQKEVIHGSKTTEVTGDHGIKVGGDYKMAAEGEADIEGSNVHLN